MAIAKNDPDYIRWLLLMNDRAVEKAIVAIYNLQTEDEKSSNDTRHSNNVGFSGADARLGSYYAKWILSGKNLTGKHLEKARNMANKYIRQLVQVATNKMQTSSIELNKLD